MNYQRGLVGVLVTWASLALCSTPSEHCEEDTYPEDSNSCHQGSSMYTAHQEESSTAAAAEGTSVWCQGTNHTNRICRFRNLCYIPEQDDFVFFHGTSSILSGVPHERFSPALLDMSSVHDHNMQYFNYVDLPADRAKQFKVRFVEGPSLIVRRFNPDNLMHVFHDDLLPLYYTLHMMTAANIAHRSGDGSGRHGFAVQLVFMEGWPPGSHADLYDLLTTQKLLYQSDLQNTGVVTCFKDVSVGLTKTTTWYQYGFRVPQGPIPGHTVTSIEIRQFTNFFTKSLGIDNKDVVVDDEKYAVLLTRKNNRLILNEVDLAFAVIKDVNMKLVSLSVETGNITDLVDKVSRASILIGMHGSLLSLAMFLPPGRVIIELFPFAINPENYTPYKTLAQLPGMGIVYRSWRNMNEENTVTHPARSWDLGGITHISEEEQKRIKSSKEVPPHLCCRDPAWLFRIYQDTVVNIPEVITLIQDALHEGQSASLVTVEQLVNDKILPTFVQNLSCKGSGDEKGIVENIEILQGSNERDISTQQIENSENKQPSLFVSWEPPWNLAYLDFVKRVKYEVWIQEENQELYSAYILSRMSYSFTSSLKKETIYNIWVRCVLDEDHQGPFNKQVVNCRT